MLKLYDPTPRKAIGNEKARTPEWVRAFGCHSEEHQRRGRPSTDAIFERIEAHVLPPAEDATPTQTS